MSLTSVASSSTCVNIRRHRNVYALTESIATYKSSLIAPVVKSPCILLQGHLKDETSLGKCKSFASLTLSLTSPSEPLVMKVTSIKVDSNLTLWKVDTQSNGSSPPSSSPASKESLWRRVKSNDSNGRNLVVLFSYMLAKERHIEKYRQIYHRHGFDVLTITTSPLQFFLPPFGAKKIASKLLLYLNSNITQYSSMSVHAFSVGGYQYSEFLSQIKSTAANSELNSHPLANCIKGTIFDSPCDVDSVPYGLSHTVAGDTLLAKGLQVILNLTRFIFYPLSTKYHSLGAEVFAHQPLSCPSLFFASQSDKMANIKVIQSVVDAWTKKGVDVDLV